ncbi:MAG: CotH kinase family protein [Prevotellaceae bacterium]|nr:CotH kinase family protein [Candidatus Minthosoma equi]
MKRIYLTLLLLLFFIPIHLDAQTYKRVTNLPHVFVETFNRASITSKTTYIYATMHYVDENDVVTEYDSLQIRGRGNSTWNISKKPYRIKFKEKEKFLGTGYAKAKSWTLIANAGDKTLMRNAITSLMGDFLGLKNNPAHKFVDLTLNGTYIGNYMISDHVEVRPHRVNISEQDIPLTEESDITGGYLLEIDGFADGNCFTTSTYAAPVRIHYPDEEDIESAQNTYIRNYINNFEKVLSSSSFADPENGYRPLVDSVSLANWFIATEVSGNIDGYWSTYFYKEKQDPRLYFGPLWDYDIAYANDNRKGDTSRQLMTDVGYGQTRLWMNRMWEDPWFARLISRRYEEVVDAGLEDFMYQQIDSISELIYDSQLLNYKKWGINVRMLRERILYSSYSQYVTDLKSYIGKHIPYLETAFANKKPADPTPPFVAENYWYRIINAGTATALDVSARSGMSGDKACSWQNTAEQESQNWQIVPVGNYFMIINRIGNLALNDPTVGACTPTTNTGTQLNVVTANETDKRQLWTLTPQGTLGYYNLTNLSTGHTANLNGGNSGNGTSIMSYNTDSRNSISNNRLWYIMPEDEIDDPSAIADVEPDEYALAYNPAGKMLHFGAENPEQLTFTAKIYGVNGTLIKSFPASEQCSVADLPRGIYIIMWSVGGQRRSTKMLIE